MDKSDLIILNYRMDENDQVFSHQLQLVSSLAANFRHVKVISAKTGKYSVPENVRVYSVNWQEGHHLSNIFNFLRLSIPVITRNRKAILFSHMTEQFTVLVLPLTLLLRVKHVLWYAHADRNLSLRIVYFGVSKIVTSTVGSFPFPGRKITYIGQGVSTSDFQPGDRATSLDFTKFIHIGRLDKSKNILGIINFCKALRNSSPGLRLTLVGKHIKVDDTNYMADVQRELFLNRDWIDFHPGSPRGEIPAFLQKSDLFVHLFEGSLDKALIEATLSGIPVLTINKEYVRIFGKWNNSTNSEELTLVNEYLSLKNLSLENLKLELDRRLKIAQDSHGFDMWCQKLTGILYES